jgi:hypothetical protein
MNLVLTMMVASNTPVPVELASAMAVVICALPNYLVAERLVFTR